MTNGDGKKFCEMISILGGFLGKKMKKGDRFSVPSPPSKGIA
jgi:hypothetical protein